MPKVKRNEFIFEEDLLKQASNKNEIFTQMDLVSDECKEIMENPFLFNYESKEFVPSSIEDFGLVYKKKKVYLRSIIRNPSLKKSQKVRIFKKYIRKQRKEFYLKKDKLEEKKHTNEERISDVTFAYDKKARKLIIFFGVLVNFILVAMFNLGRLNFINSKWLVDVTTTLNNKLNSDVYTKTICWGSFCLVLGLLIYLICFRISCIKYKRLCKKYLKVTQKTFKVFEKKFRKLYFKVTNYYLKMIKSSSKSQQMDFKPLSFDEVWNQKNTLSNISLTQEKIKTKTEKVINYQKKHKIIKGCLYLLVLILDLILIINIVIILI